MSPKRIQEAEFIIPAKRFDAGDYVDSRLAAVPHAVRGSLKTALQYLYLTDGPRNLPASRKRTAEPYLQTAERVAIRWLHPRTNGALRKSYGHAALQCARRARFRCERCGNADVRVLEFDHVDGRGSSRRFAVLCANCHRIKSRTADWTGRRRDRVS